MVFPRLHIIQCSIQINYYVKYGKLFTKNLTLLFNNLIINNLTHLLFNKSNLNTI